ncbi:MAG: glycine zipper family protein [Candidatus Hydrogenedentes bacterium]|nr:glycine zipper family protein [Candidatus Hydrogenedentota bacterium]
MKHSMPVKLTSVVLAVAFVLAGCATQGGSAGTGALIGGALGGVIGHQSGHAWEGAAIGAVVGALAGLVVHDVKERRLRTAQETYSDYGYQPSQGFQMDLRGSSVSPQVVAPGGEVTTSMEYATLGTGGGTPVREYYALEQGTEHLADIHKEEVQRTDGTWQKSVTFEVPEDAPEGRYEVMQQVTAKDTTLQRTSDFTVERRNADAGSDARLASAH